MSPPAAGRSGGRHRLKASFALRVRDELIRVGLEFLGLHDLLEPLLDGLVGRRSDVARGFQPDDVPAVLRLDGRAGELARLQGDDGVGEGLDHPVRREPAEIAAIALGDLVHGLTRGQLGEVCAFLQALHELLRECFRGDEDVACVVLLLRKRGNLRVVLGPQLLLGRLLVFEIPLGHGLLQHLQPRKLQQGSRLGLLVEAVAGGLVGDHPHADEIVQ